MSYIVNFFSKNRNKFFMAVLSVLFLFQFLFVSPIGNFVLNDSWVHVDSILHLFKTGDFRLIPWAGPTFYIPVLYGFGIVKIFGNSFTLFRVSTLAISFVLLLVFYKLVLDITKKPVLGFLFTLVLWLSPIFYNLSFTFMTDLPALFFLLVGIYFYYEGFKNKNKLLLALGSLVGVVGFFVRQTNILLMASSGVYYLIKNLYAKKGSRNDIKEVIINFFGIYIVPGIIFLVVYAHLHYFNLLPQNIGKAHFKDLNLSFLGHFLRWVWFYLSYSALFLFPILVGLLLRERKIFQSLSWWLSLLVAVVSSYLFSTSWHGRYEKIGNIINQFGLGPYRVIRGELEMLISKDLFLIIDLLAGMCLAVFVSYCINNYKKIGSEVYFVAIFMLSYLFVVSSVVAFDRYILPIFLSVIIIFASLLKNVRINNSIAILLVSLIGFFSIVETSHYLNWNQARSEVANSVLKSGVPAQKIDAGVEWNGVHDYWNTLHTKVIAPDSAPWWIRDMFSANKGVYVVSFSKLEEYNIVERKDLSSWLNPNDKIYLLKKK